MEYVDNRSYFQTIWAPIASVGWYIVGLAIIAYITFPHIEEKYKNWKLKRKQQNETAFNKKTDQSSQLGNIELIRQKMQDTYNKSCTLAQLKEEEIKAKKRQKLLETLKKQNVGRKLGSSDLDTTDTMDDEMPSTSTKSKSFKSEYNPLMGDNTRGYRPPKRSCCGKGCG